MKTILISFLLALFLLPPNVSSQEFAPLGATWVYQNVSPGNHVAPALLRFSATRDTIINNRGARIIQKEALYYDGSWESEGQEIVASSGDSVFVYYEDEFYLIYDFTRKKGDTIRVIDLPFDGFLFTDVPWNADFSHFRYKIDSTSSFVQGVDTLAMQYASYLENPADSFQQWGFQNVISLSHEPPLPGIIMEGVGALGFESMLGTSAGISYITDYGIEQLTCYSDSLRTINF